MLVVLTETYCNKVNIQITQRDDFIQTSDACFNLLSSQHISLFNDKNLKPQEYKVSYSIYRDWGLGLLYLYIFHHHHHHIPEGIGVFPVPRSSR